MNKANFITYQKKNCVKTVQIRSFFWAVFSCIRTECGDLLRKSPYFSPNTGKYGPEKTLYLDTFQAVKYVIFLKTCAYPSLDLNVRNGGSFIKFSMDVVLYKYSVRTEG